MDIATYSPAIGFGCDLSAQRFVDLPQVPTVAELGQATSGGGGAVSYAGLQHFKLSSWNALAAPADAVCPSSTTVGTCGKSAKRWAELTASARSTPPPT